MIRHGSGRWYLGTLAWKRHDVAFSRVEIGRRDANLIVGQVIDDIGGPKKRVAEEIWALCEVLDPELTGVLTWVWPAAEYRRRVGCEVENQLIH